jgi:hypothetical protein
VIDGRVVLALDHHVLALDASSGALRWRRDLDGRRLGGVAVREGLVVAVSVREPDPSGLEARRVPVLEAFDLADGASVWQQPLQGDHPLPPVAAGRRAIVTTRKNPAEIVAVDLLTGRPAGRLRVSERYLACDPAILAGRRMLLSPDSRSELWLVDLDRLEASWQDSLVSTEVDALRPGAGGFLVSGLAVRRQNADGAGANLAIRQRLVLVDPDRPGIAWQAELDPGATLDAAYVLADGDGWLFPVRDRNGGVELTSLDAHGRLRHRPIPLFEPRVFQTPLYSVFGGVLALGFDPTAHERRNQPTAHFVLIDADRGQVVKRWSASEPAPPRGRGIWPTRTGFFVAWPDRIEFYDLGTQNAR